MGKFRHIVGRWRNAILRDEEHADSIPQSPVLDLEPFLDLSTMATPGTWKDLPQEIVDHIVSMLGNDLKLLKACSLTCKAMFFSTRHLIHRRIRLTSEQNWEVLTLREKQRYIRGDRQGIAIKVLSGIAAHGLLPYGRQLSINLNGNFTPANLQPFNHHFQRFERIQELSIDKLHVLVFLRQFDIFFANFVPTLRSLHLDTPIGHTRDILDFVCRFPHLDDLTLRWSLSDSRPRGPYEETRLPSGEGVPPFRGRLKLYWLDRRRGCILQQLISLPGKLCFRFVDFRGFPAWMEQRCIDACSGTIETLSITWQKYDAPGLPLKLTDVKNLRSLTLRVDIETIRRPYEALVQTLHTITSPSFSEFVLEVGHVPETLEPADSAWKWRGTWIELDKMFERMEIERGFKVVIRAERVDRDLNFIAQARDRLSLMNTRERLVFEIGPFPEK